MSQGLLTVVICERDMLGFGATNANKILTKALQT